MKNAQNARKQRGRPSPRKGGRSGGGRDGAGNRNDNRSRGNPKQLLEKYKTQARDALQGGDPVNAEYYFQFADHYQRLVNDMPSNNRDQGNRDQGNRDQNNRDQNQRNQSHTDQNRDQQAESQQAEGQQAEGQQGEASSNNESGGDNEKSDRPRRGRGRRDHQSRNNRDNGQTENAPVEAHSDDSAEKSAPSVDLANTEQPVEVHPELNLDAPASEEKPKRKAPVRRRRVAKPKEKPVTSDAPSVDAAADEGDAAA
ncbi:MAG: hypothetical protein COB37_12535 [Kordiimonadales bacterium]|nr:MAG: hypothetical protein COB37_12535 [Kordiimonadales bacterium]